MTGCYFKTNNNGVQTNECNSVAQNYFNMLLKKDKGTLLKASPEDIINMYYSSINDRNYNLALVCAPCFLNNCAINRR